MVLQYSAGASAAVLLSLLLLRGFQQQKGTVVHYLLQCRRKRGFAFAFARIAKRKGTVVHYLVLLYSAGANAVLLLLLLQGLQQQKVL